MREDEKEEQVLNLESHEVSEVDIPVQEEAVATKTIRGLPVSFVSGAFFTASVIAIVLLNKTALSGFKFHSPNTLLMLQCAVSVLGVLVCRALGLVEQVEPLSLTVAIVWFPVNLIFVGCIATSFWALQSLTVAMMSVLKNLQNLFTIAGDYYFYSRTYNWGVWSCIILMLVSALVACYTDLAFSPSGYFWQTVNCLLTAAYSLYLPNVMERVAPVTSTGQKLNELSMVYYNNLLSIPLILVVMVLTGEATQRHRFEDIDNPKFLLVAFMSGILGFSMSFSSLWFLANTTPTIFSVVNSLNKVPLSILGLLLFNAPSSVANIVSVLIGLLAASCFALVKSGSKKA